MLATEDLLPQRVIDQYQMTPEMWADKIKLWYTDFQGMQRYWPATSVSGCWLFLIVIIHFWDYGAMFDKVVGQVSFYTKECYTPPTISKCWRHCVFGSLYVCLWTQYFTNHFTKFTVLVHLRTKKNLLDFEVKRSKVKVTSKLNMV